MAELGAIASIVGIAAAGAKISMTLYELGSTVGSAKRDINKVAVSIATFCSVLQQLASTLEKARSARFSVSAIETTQEILDRCTELFSEIEEVVKKLEMGQQGGRSPKQTSIGHVARVKWVFQRAKVQRLHAELESMKLTLTLMLIALNLAEKIRARRESEKILTQEELDEDEEIQSIGATLLVAQQNVEDEIEDLEALEQDSEDEEVPGNRNEEHDSLSQPQDKHPDRKPERHQSFRASLWMASSIPEFDLDMADRPVTWANEKHNIDNRQLFINLLKRWANYEISESLAVKPAAQESVTLPVSSGESSLIIQHPTVPSFIRQEGTAALVPIGTYIKEKIESFKNNGDAEEGLTFDLSARLLTAVPDELIDLAGNQVSRLALPYNHFQDFFVPYNTFTNLRYLNLKHNNLLRISKRITSIKALEVLDLAWNRIECLPDHLIKLKCLKVLSLSRNYILEPPVILADLLNLDVVFINRNPLLKSMGYEKFEGLGWDEINVKDTIRLTEEFKEKLREHKIMETADVSLTQELGFI